MLPKSKSLKFLVIFLIIVLLVLAGWWFFKPKEAPTQYLTADAEIGNIEDTVLATGTLQAEQLVSVGAQVSGQVKKMYVKLGDDVKKGQLIAQIDSIRQENDLKNQEAAIDNLQAQKAVRLASLKESELAFKRQKDMLAQDATSRAEYEQAESSLATARANIQAIDAQIEQSKLTVSTSRENVGYTRISAPIDGTVVAIVTEEGQTVNANQSAPTIVKLAKLNTMTIKAQISEADVIRVQKGQTVYFTTLGDPDTKIYATLRDIEPAPESISTDSNSASTSSTAIYYNALFDVPNPDGKLRIDMTAQVYIVLNEAKNVLTIPAAALTTNINPNPTDKADGKKSAERQRNAKSDNKNAANAKDRMKRVWVMDAEGKPQQRRVQIGLNNRITAEVISGLKAGDKVIIADGSDTSQNGAKRSSNSANRAMRM
jgi:macrolide-specific efflux system membrane fusion protein